MAGIRNFNATIVCAFCREETPKTAPGQKYCPSCRREAKLLYLRYLHRKRWKKPEYREKYNKRQNIYWNTPENKVKISRQKAIRRENIRREVVEHYGGKCACCGEKEFRFMAIDHINGGGAQHRKSLGVTSIIPSWFKKNNYPPGFRILCHNCNMALGAYGVCHVH